MVGTRRCLVLKTVCRNVGRVPSRGACATALVLKENLSPTNTTPKELQHSAQGCGGSRALPWVTAQIFESGGGAAVASI